MQVYASITYAEITAAAASFGLSTEEFGSITALDPGTGKITLVAYPGHARSWEFLGHLVKYGLAFPDLDQPGRWEMTP